MFLLDEPFVSDFLTDTLNKNSYDVMYSDILKGKTVKFCSDAAFDSLNGLDYPKIYTNSENSLNKIITNLKDTKLPHSIGIFKDKVKFRELISSIYPDFYYREISYEDLKTVDKTKLNFPLVIKPAVGFLSFGVSVIYSVEEYDDALKNIEKSMEASIGLFPSTVLDSSKFIIEDYIEGDEFALDVYIDKDSNPVILDVFYHPFLDKYDVSDRMYISSPKIIKENYELFEDLLKKIAKKAMIKNFPFHIELKKNKNNIIPVEINPLRFAGWCLCDLAYYAYGINIYEYFMEDKKPDWNKIINMHRNEVFAFVIMEVPNDVDKSKIKDFDIEKLRKDLDNVILNERKFDFLSKPIFYTFFVKSDSIENLKHILSLKSKDYIRLK